MADSHHHSGDDHDENGASLEGSAIDVVARHEHELLEKLANADAEAARILAQGRQDAEAVIADKERALAAEAARLHAEAAAERDSVRKGILQEAEARGIQVRESGSGKLGTAVDQLVALVLPQTGSAS